MDKARLERIENWMRGYREAGRYSGSSLLVYRHGEEAFFAADGLASLAREQAYKRDTIVRIYSMTKLVTTTLFMMLVERGQVVLDAPVSQYLPEFGQMRALRHGAGSLDQTEPARAPTLHELLTHTSGMTYGFNEGIVPQAYAKAFSELGLQFSTLEAWCKVLAELPLCFQPGAAWEYSVGIDVIGRVIEVIMGEPLAEAMQREIFDPLEMQDTGFDVPASKLARFADCYQKKENDLLALFDCADASSRFAEGRVSMHSGGGGLVSTLDDYMRFGEMIRLGGALGDVRLLSPRTLRFMASNHLAGDIASMGAASFAEMPMTGMGFGLGGAVVLDPARVRVPGSVGDFGWGGLASTYFWTDPVEQMSVVYFTQLIPSSSYTNRAELKALIHGALLD
ncbi:serine hydrolase domain-containing protein [Lentibacter sp. XHP0401]|uniref:serine hydrolase domain-containing protein n=1 Tax=Lentibacter sp. XHP0401 TaxID=2984334 RepID=UPI0021E96F6C|nr:serine hydrolase domain-containing protein [Lentibacter sp. XHP0401]MCV2893219.1 beta-lactamase family protein [Lentibacter sp. XHP0401]